MERDGEAEVVEGNPVIGDELLGFGPGAVDEGEDVDGALGGIAADGRAVSPDDQGLSIDGDGGAKLSKRPPSLAVSFCVSEKVPATSVKA